MPKRLFCTLCIAVAASAALAATGHEKTLAAKNTQYQYLSVHEDTQRKERYLRSKRGEMNQGGVSLEHPEQLVLPYTQIAFIGLAFLDREPGDALFLGLGVGSMPRYFNRYYPSAMVDVVEIDPDVPPLAKKYFFFHETPRMRLSVEDGRIFVKRARRQYDLIFLDAYQNDSIPFHLTTAEFLREVKAKLKPGGVVVANILARDINRFFDAMVVTYRKVFPQVYIFKWKFADNYIFVATDTSRFLDKKTVAGRAAALQSQKRFDINLTEISQWYDTAASYEKAGEKPLTDDFAPVNIYQHQKTGGRK
ncbi:MAG: hypothetical protein OHK006_02000 [Thermodesulfovibrionales bacterium]